MSVQATYLDNLPIGYVGEIADLGLSDVISRIAEGGGGIGFGKPVIQGTADSQCMIGAAGSFLGLSVRDVTLAPDANDTYAAGDVVAVMTKGVMWVTAGEAVVAGDAVYRTAAGVLNKTATGNTLIANARWETSAANGALAKIRLS